MLILNTDVPLPTITTATMSLQFPMHTNSEPTLDIEGANLQNQGVCGVLTGVVTHVMNTHLTEEQGAVIQNLRQKEQTPK